MSLLQFPLWLLLLPLQLVRRLFLALGNCWYRKRCGELWVMDLGGDDETPDFYDQIDRALQFIREHDPRRANWIEQHLRYIVSSPIIESGGCYLRESKSCYINYRSYYRYIVGWGELTERAQEVLTMELATIIVHEATHGRIEDAGIRYRDERRERIEKLCRRQEKQFLDRAAPDFCDMNGQLVDWAKAKNFEQSRDFYKEYWRQSWWGHMRKLLRNGWREITEKPEEEEVVATWRERHQHFAKLAEAYQPWTDGMLYARGVYHWQAMNFREARTDLRSFLDRNPEHGVARCCLAMMLYKMWHWEESLALWKEALAEEEEHAASWIASVLLYADRHEEALEWLENETVSDDETYVASLRARILIGLGREDEALQSYDEALLDGEAEANEEAEELAFNSDEFSMLAERALLLRKLGKREKFREAKEELYANAKQYWTSCKDAPTEIEAFVLKTHPEIYEPGVLCIGARLLICPELAGQPREAAYLETIAAQLLENMDSDSNEYEALYLRSLLQGNDEYPWREVPESLTGGRQVFVVDMNLDRLFLPDEMLTSNYVTCMIAPWGDDYTAYLRMDGEGKSIAMQEVLLPAEC